MRTGGGKRVLRFALAIVGVTVIAVWAVPFLRAATDLDARRAWNERSAAKSTSSATLSVALPFAPSGECRMRIEPVNHRRYWSEEFSCAIRQTPVLPPGHYRVLLSDSIFRDVAKEFLVDGTSVELLLLPVPASPRARAEVSADIDLFPDQNLSGEPTSTLGAGTSVFTLQRRGYSVEVHDGQSVGWVNYRGLSPGDASFGFPSGGGDIPYDWIGLGESFAFGPPFGRPDVISFLYFKEDDVSRVYWLSAPAESAMVKLLSDALEERMAQGGAPVGTQGSQEQPHYECSRREYFVIDLTDVADRYGAVAAKDRAYAMINDGIGGLKYVASPNRNSTRVVIAYRPVHHNWITGRNEPDPKALPAYGYTAAYGAGRASRWTITGSSEPPRASGVGDLTRRGESVKIAYMASIVDGFGRVAVGVCFLDPTTSQAPAS